MDDGESTRGESWVGHEMMNTFIMQMMELFIVRMFVVDIPNKWLALEALSAGPESWGFCRGLPSPPMILFCLCEKPATRRSMPCFRVAMTEQVATSRRLRIQSVNRAFALTLTDHMDSAFSLPGGLFALC